jgi:hypothetical protein
MSLYDMFGFILFALKSNCFCVIVIGTGSQDESFLRPLKLIWYFMSMRLCYFTFLDARSKLVFRKPHHNFCTCFFLYHWLIFSSAHSSLDAGEICVNMIFQDNSRVPVSVFIVKIIASEHLNRVTARIFRFSRYFYRSKSLKSSKLYITTVIYSKILKAISVHKKTLI